ncbi:MULTISPECIES: MFS transporter [Nocardia]|jgi:MFS family permease|uniref:MFS transporter n=1 Tax=Nocardia abscessus TaxID=120957 RepID=UPI001894517D|nr:MFS transporter [Nocardia abscessus]MBF6476086.1 MFS transporter [Nocardia abscessus]
MPLNRLWRRQLDHYPSAPKRYSYLAITVLCTVVLYYELYVQGAVATTIMSALGASFGEFVAIAVIGNLLGAFASLAAGLADRWGRANLVVAGLLITGMLVLFGLPAASSFGMYSCLFVLLCVVEGVVLVATPALIRDFSPQLGRASAMGYWTLGPVLGSILVTTVSSRTAASHPEWQFQFRVCGTIGLLAATIALLGLRELAPRLRDQLMVSLGDRRLIEARARQIDPVRALRGHWRQMLRLDVLASAGAISVYLIFYYIAVGFFVVYFATVFGYSEARANALAEWFWISIALALPISGAISDRLRVRKPFMIAGGVLSAGAVAVFAGLATRPDTSYYHFAIVLVVLGSGTGLAYCTWMAGFTETVERHNPAATATGLAVWAWINRLVVTVALAGFGLMLPAVSTLVDQGHEVSRITTAYRSQLATLDSLTPATRAALANGASDSRTRDDAVAQLLAGGAAADEPTASARVRQLADHPIPQADQQFLRVHGPAVADAERRNPAQWQRWWLVCLAGQLVFIPLTFVMSGRWSPKQARLDEARHRAEVERHLAELGLSEAVQEAR